MSGSFCDATFQREQKSKRTTHELERDDNPIASSASRSTPPLPLFAVVFSFFFDNAHAFLPLQLQTQQALSCRPALAEACERRHSLGQEVPRREARGLGDAGELN